MRLRFRGTCLDEGEAPASSTHRLVPDAASCSGKQSSPLPSVSQLFRKEGRLGKAPSPGRPPRARQSSELPSWPCTLAFKRSCGTRETKNLEDNRDVDNRGDWVKIGRQKGQKSKDVRKAEEISTHRADHAQSLSTSPACCVVVSDPANDVMPEPSFSTIVLADQHRRQRLFSVRQDVLLMGLHRVASSTTAPSTAPVKAECAGVGPPLQELIQFVHQAVAILRCSEEGTAVAAAVQESAPDVQREERLQPITLDLDEEVSVQLEKGFAINGTKGVRDSTSTGSCQSTTETNDFSGTSTQMDILPRPPERSPSVWGALDIVHLLTLQDIPPHSYCAASATLCPDRSTCIQSRVAFIPRPPYEPPSTMIAVKDKTWISELREAFGSFPALWERASGDFSRIDVEIFVTGGDLRLQANKNYVGLLDVLGGMKGEIQMGCTRFEHDFFADLHGHRHYDPRSPSIGEGRHPLLRNRAPRAISIPVAGSSGKGPRKRERRWTRRDRQRESRSCFDHHTERGQGTGDYIPSFALLRMALAKAAAVYGSPWPASPPSWVFSSRASVERPGLIPIPARHSIRAINTHGERNEGPTRNGQHLRDDTSRAEADAVLAGILATWRNKHYYAEPVGRAQPSHAQTRPQRPPPPPLSTDTLRVSSSSTPRPLCPPAHEDQAQFPDSLVPTQSDSNVNNVLLENAEQARALPFGCTRTGTSSSATLRISPPLIPRQLVVAQEEQLGRTAIPKQDMPGPKHHNGGLECDDHPGRASSKEGRKTPGCDPVSDASKSIMQEVHRLDKADDTQRICYRDSVAKLLVGVGCSEPPAPSSALYTGNSPNAAPEPRGTPHTRFPPAEGVHGSSDKSSSSKANEPTRAYLLALPDHASVGYALQSRPSMASLAMGQSTEGEGRRAPANRVTGVGAAEALAPTVSSENSPSSSPPARRQGVCWPTVEVHVARQAGTDEPTNEHERDTHDNGTTAPEQIPYMAQHGVAPTEGGAEDDTAMAECKSSRQREILSMLRTGALEGAVTLSCRGSSDSGKKRPSAETVAELKFPRRHSDPGRSAPVISAYSTASKSALGTKTSAVAAGRASARIYDGRPIYAVISEEFVSTASKVVLTLSSPPKEVPAAAVPPLHLLPSVTHCAAAISGPRCARRFAFLELPVERPVDLVVGSRSAVVIMDSRSGINRNWDTGRVPISVPRREEGVLHADNTTLEATVTEAREKLRLLTLQTLKYSTVWLIVRMDRDCIGVGAERRQARLNPALKKLEQWLVGFPCRIYIRYSRSEAQLVELITHVALNEKLGGGTTTGTATSAVHAGAKRRRLDTSAHDTTTSQGWSPLEVINENSLKNPEWAAFHHRQAWFLQLFPALNAFSASALLSSASLKHLIVTPYEELAPALLGRGGVGGWLVRGGVTAESLAEFCAAVRLQRGGTRGGNPHAVVTER